ncbi:MAG TPA: bifunctional oligoribonuclease/PAP phosphatase NrnA [Anaerolineales bacterium]|nr:bifunctional oligoribonuclease/PAP phosphatase NrnA [Anaerolineales bacterium]
MNDLQQKIKGRLQAAKRVLIASHIRPDGDAIGSSLAIGLALQDAGKQVRVVFPKGVPDNFGHLPGIDLVHTRLDGEFDTFICLDCSGWERLGETFSGLPAPDLVIDHHETADKFGKINLVRRKAVATAEVLFLYMRSWGLTVTPAVAANLLTGFITDTIGFRTPNTTPKTLRQAAKLADLGADLSNLYLHGLVEKSYPAVKYWGTGLSTLQRSDGILWASLTVADRNKSGYKGNDDADLINLLSSVNDADIAIMFVEQDERMTKVSWRALKPYIDVSQIACQFKGGGHKAAAGAEVSGSLPEVRECVLDATRRSLASIQGNTHY